MAFQLLHFNRARAALLHDTFMAALSFSLSLYLRVGESIQHYPQSLLWNGTIIFAVVCALVFSFSGMYRGIWRYASLNDLMAITKGVTLSILIFLLLMFLMTRLESLPRSAIFINWFVLMALLGGPRFLYRVSKDRHLENVLARDDYSHIPVLLVGAGDAAELFLRDLARDAESPYRVLGMLSDKPSRLGREIHGVAVVGLVNDLEEVVARLKKSGPAPQRLIVTKDDLDGAMVRRLLDQADALGLALARLPRLSNLKGGVSEHLEIKPVAIEDLLGRPQTVLDRPAMKALIKDKPVLVTGAGGTIGSELARQICALGPSQIAMLDNSEFQLYSIDLEIATNHPDLPRSAVICDVRDRKRLDEIMAVETPAMVFHAAALKHVPMVEANPCEGILTNVIGSRNVANACVKAKAEMMVQVSTDKAVNPTSIMGASKRLAESYCQSLGLSTGIRRMPTQFVTVRFGNVLGSTGSVVPLFQQQLAAGGPLTVTHPDMKRYFMTTREAVELVLQASALAGRETGLLEEGGIFVLDMGEPVRILDLARQVIRLAGMTPDTDVQIEFTGVRPGEKLFEELFHDSEPLVPTKYESILLATPRTVDHEVLLRALNKLEELARAGKTEKALATLAHLVPDYHPAVETETSLPPAQASRS
jgi:O-antigen biosynthesis protein WbqV